MARIWSTEEKEYLKQITPGHHYKEIAEFMNSKFNMEFSLDQIKNAINRYKLNTGFNGQFKKGQTSHNKGVKGKIYEGSKKTWFKKNNKPHNHRIVGSERINVYGYIEIKVKEPNKWRLKHNVIWEKHNGPVPKDFAIIFGNGNKLNLDINNLILVSRQQLAIMNNKKLIKTDANSTKTGVIIADIYIQISKSKSKTKRGVINEK